MTASASVLIRCDGDSQTGLGHVMRCLAIADELRIRYSWGVTFAITTAEQGAEAARQAGFGVELKPDALAEDLWLQEVIDRLTPAALVLDVRTDLPRAAVERWRRRALVAVLDDPSERRLAADLAFFPPVPQAKAMDWAGFQGELKTGWDWAVFPQLSSSFRRPAESARPRVLVTMGGSDPACLTERAISELGQLMGYFDGVVVLGPGFLSEREAALRELLRSARRQFEVWRAPSRPELAALMAGADIAVASFGVTAYELASLGVPTIYLCLTLDHALSASALVDGGAALSLGVHHDVPCGAVARAVAGLLADTDKRRMMACRGPSLVDGRGAARVAHAIVEAAAVRTKGPAVCGACP